MKALNDVDEKLSHLQTYLREHGLSGIPLGTGQSVEDLQEQTRLTFEKRARIDDATTLVASILRGKPT